MESINNEIIDWDYLFRKELKLAFTKTKNLIKEKIVESKLIEGLSSIAFTFFEPFKDSPVPVYLPDPKLYKTDSFISASIDLPFSCFMVPYFFYNTLIENYSFDLDEEFSQSLPWSELIGLINQKWLLQRKKLTKTDVLICKVLSRYNSKNQAFKFPITLNIIANRSRLSLSSIEKTFHTLGSRMIANDFFIINPWKLGWELYLLNYSYAKDSLLTEFDSITISKEVHLNDYAYRIIQIPFLQKTDDLSKIRKLLGHICGSLHIIDSTSFNWDLSQLEVNEDKSFLNIPNFNKKPANRVEPTITFTYENDSLGWLNNTQLGKNTTNGRFKKISFEENIDTQRILKILNFIIKYGVPLNTFEKTAENLGIPENELSKLIQFLIKNEVISLVERFKFIGAGREYCFLIENGSIDLYDQIKQSLFHCPFSYFYMYKSGLAGRIQVPDKWVSKLLEFITLIQLRNKEVKFRFGQRILGYNYFNPNIKLPEDYVINEFGSYLKML